MSKHKSTSSSMIISATVADKVIRVLKDIDQTSTTLISMFKKSQTITWLTPGGKNVNLVIKLVPATVVD